MARNVSRVTQGVVLENRSLRITCAHEVGCKEAVAVSQNDVGK